MKQLRFNIDDWPDAAGRTEWSKIVNCSVATIDRAERLGKIGPAIYLNSRVKLYPKEQIMRWLNLLPPTPPPQPIDQRKKILKRVIKH
jgi:hypothetical protein